MAYAMKRPPAPRFQCDVCNGWVKQKKDGQLFSHSRSNPEYGAELLAYKNSNKTSKYPRYRLPCDGKPKGYECPCCDGTGRVGEPLT
jgi:hypothetical protein